MTNGIKAIETKYKGYRFRSRLEARWAVFFDSLNIRWEYEKEGYATPHGPYLPDFWLPDHGMFIEIKGGEPNEDEIAKARSIRDHVAPIAMFHGLPGENHGTLFCYDLGDSSGGSSEWDCFWCAYDEDPFADDVKDIILGVDCASGARVLGDVNFHPVRGSRNVLAGLVRPSSEIERAYETSRSARFEHGEQGAA